MVTKRRKPSVFNKLERILTWCQMDTTLSSQHLLSLASQKAQPKRITPGLIITFLFTTKRPLRGGVPVTFKSVNGSPFSVGTPSHSYDAREKKKFFKWLFYPNQCNYVRETLLKELLVTAYISVSEPINDKYIWLLAYVVIFLRLLSLLSRK